MRETPDSCRRPTSPSLPRCSSDPESSEGVSTLNRHSSTFSNAPPRGEKSSEGVEGRVKRTSKVSFAWHFTIHARYHSNPWCCSAACENVLLSAVIDTKLGDQSVYWVTTSMTRGRSRSNIAHIVSEHTTHAKVRKRRHRYTSVLYCRDI